MPDEHCLHEIAPCRYTLEQAMLAARGMGDVREGEATLTYYALESAGDRAITGKVEAASTHFGAIEAHHKGFQFQIVRSLKTRASLLVIL